MNILHPIIEVINSITLNSKNEYIAYRESSL